MTEPRTGPLSTSELIQLVYKELRAVAAAYMRHERPDHTLQPTALVHEAYVALESRKQVHWKSKEHFMAMAARQMRRVLVEHARRRDALKRSGRWLQVSLDEGLAIAPNGIVNLLALDQALNGLARLSDRQSLVAEYRLFGGLTVKECAALLEVSERTVGEDWRVAKTWIVRELRKH